MLCARRKETHHQRLAFLRFVASGFARVNGKILMPLFQFLAVKLLSYLTFWLYFPREARYGRVHSSDCHIEVDVPGQNVPRGTCGLQNAHRGVCNAVLLDYVVIAGYEDARFSCIGSLVLADPAAIAFDSNVVKNSRRERLIPANCGIISVHKNAHLCDSRRIP